MRVSFKRSRVRCNTKTFCWHSLAIGQEQLNAHSAVPGFHSDLSVSVRLRSPLAALKSSSAFRLLVWSKKKICALERCSKDYYAFTSNHFVSNAEAAAINPTLRPKRFALRIKCLLEVHVGAAARCSFVKPSSAASVGRAIATRDLPVIYGDSDRYH